MDENRIPLIQRPQQQGKVAKCLLLALAILAYTYNMHGQITSWDNADSGGGYGYYSSGPTCSGGILPIYIYGCDSGVMDVDCGNSKGCLAYLLAKCTQKITPEDYIKCVKTTVATCQSQGYLRPFDAQNILGCAYTAGYKK